MNFLEERIIKDGEVYPGDILKIDSFLNHQIDTRLMDQIGKKFHKIFIDLKPTKILTIEASGIAIAEAVSRYFDFVPVVFAKKNKALNLNADVYKTEEKSYTRDAHYTVSVSKEYINKEDKVLIIDDFLANGEALNSLVGICKQAGCEVLGCGCVVCKTYQPGKKRIQDMGYRVETLANIKSMDNGIIEFD